jgi:hypothetical protein
MDPENPQVGDLLIRFSALMPDDVSIVSVQRGNGFMLYFAANGDTIELLEYGRLSAQQVFQSAQDRNTLLTWIIRALAFRFAFIGLRMLLRILPVLAAMIPAIGGLVDALTGLITFILSTAIFLITIASAWVYYRPGFAVALLVGTPIVTAGLIWAKSAKRKQAVLQMNGTAIPTTPPPA